MRAAILAAVSAALLAVSAAPAHAETWTYKFGETFDTPAALGQFNSVYGSKFANYDGSTDTTGHGTYGTAQTTSVHDGALDVWLHSSKVGPQWKHWVSALLPKWEPNCYELTTCGTLTYGYVGFDFKADPAQGYKIAYLLWPDDNQWPQHGEIDFPESCGDLAGNICWANHWAQTNWTLQEWGDTGVDFQSAGVWQGWHHVDLYWYPGWVGFYLDNVLVGESWDHDGLHVGSSPMHFVLQNETATNGTVPTNQSQGHVLVDNLYVYDIDYP